MDDFDFSLLELTKYKMANPEKPNNRVGKKSHSNNMKKLKLKSFAVKSFITKLGSNKTTTIKGGIMDEGNTFKEPPCPTDGGTGLEGCIND